MHPVYEHTGHVKSQTHNIALTHTVIWLNMSENLACWLQSDIFITLHPPLSFNTILLPQLLLSISGNRTHFLLCPFVCTSVLHQQRRETFHILFSWLFYCNTTTQLTISVIMFNLYICPHVQKHGRVHNKGGKIARLMHFALPVVVYMEVFWWRNVNLYFSYLLISQLNFLSFTLTVFPFILKPWNLIDFSFPTAVLSLTSPCLSIARSLPDFGKDETSFSFPWLYFFSLFLHHTINHI